MNIRPRNNQVLIKRIPEEKSPIEIPDSSKEKPQIGTVEQIGMLVKDLSIGDKVVFRKYAGDEFPGQEEEILLMDEIEIIGVILEGN